MKEIKTIQDTLFNLRSDEDLVAKVEGDFAIEGIAIPQKLKDEFYEILRGEKTFDASIKESVQRYCNGF